MRRLLGIFLMAFSVIAAAILLATGNLGSERAAHTASGNTPVGGWHLTVVDFDPNW